MELVIYIKTKSQRKLVICVNKKKREQNAKERGKHNAERTDVMIADLSRH